MNRLLLLDFGQAAASCVHVPHTLCLPTWPPASSAQGRTSHCYRIAYRSMERSLTDEEVNALQEAVRR